MTSDSMCSALSRFVANDQLKGRYMLTKCNQYSMLQLCHSYYSVILQPQTVACPIAASRERVNTRLQVSLLSAVLLLRYCCYCCCCCVTCPTVNQLGESHFSKRFGSPVCFALSLLPTPGVMVRALRLIHMHCICSILRGSKIQKLQCSLRFLFAKCFWWP
jgi:hypothetical protein